MSRTISPSCLIIELTNKRPISDDYNLITTFMGGYITLSAINSGIATLINTQE